MIKSGDKLAAVTGGRGFIGRNLVQRLLADGWRVRVLSRRMSNDPLLPPAVSVFCGDLISSDASDLQAFVDGCDVLFHCAGEIRDEASMEKLHVGGAAVLSSVAAGRIGRWVQLSSAGVYGPIRHGLVSETHDTAPVGLYETTKHQSDLIVSSAACAGGFELATLRPTNVFGCDMPNRSLRQLLAAVRYGLFAFVGPPGASANYIHVDDVVQAMIGCANNNNSVGRTYNLSSWTTIEEFIAAMAEAAEVVVPTRRLPEEFARSIADLAEILRLRFVTHSRIDALTNRARYSMRAIEDDIGFRIRTSLEDRVRQVARKWLEK